MKDTKNELVYIRQMLKFLDSHQMVAIVGDAYDIFNFAQLLGSIKDEIIEKTKGGKFVVLRPDSGDPVVVNRQLIEILGEKFGYTINSKGFKVLKHVRLIQGDGVNELTIRSILGAFMAMGWSADNIAFGMGGALLQQIDRDTQRFAMKCSSVCIDGEWRDVQKDPITDSGKKSKAGRVDLWTNGTDYVSAVSSPECADWTSALQTVFANGILFNECTFDEVRMRSNV